MEGLTFRIMGGIKCNVVGPTPKVSSVHSKIPNESPFKWKLEGIVQSEELKEEGLSVPLRRAFSIGSMWSGIRQKHIRVII